MNEAPTPAEIAALHDWLAAMGADGGLAETPTDWFARERNGGRRDATVARHEPSAAPHATQHTAPTARQGAPGTPGPAPAPPSDQPPRPVAAPSPPPSSPSRPPAVATPPDQAVLAARAAARSAPSLEALRATLEGFEGCGLRATAKQLCFYRGSPQARLMLIGEAPGRDEDIAGKPFVGRAGQLLDRMLAAIGQSEADVHITNVVYWRPPGNRTPTPQEAQICQPFLERQIELVAPDILLLLGGAAAKQVLDTQDGIMRLRGKWRTYLAAGREIRVMPSLHPAYLLRTPAAKRQAWQDLLAVQAALVGT